MSRNLSLPKPSPSLLYITNSYIVRLIFFWHTLKKKPHFRTLITSAPYLSFLTKSHIICLIIRFLFITKLLRSLIRETSRVAHVGGIILICNGFKKVFNLELPLLGGQTFHFGLHLVEIHVCPCLTSSQIYLYWKLLAQMIEMRDIDYLFLSLLVMLLCS